MATCFQRWSSTTPPASAASSPSWAARSTPRRAIAARAERDQYLVGPDSGVFTLFCPPFSDSEPEAVELTDTRWWRDPAATSSTFHGRDIFAPVAAHLARMLQEGSADLSAFGPPARDLRCFDFPTPVEERDGGYRGEVLHVDHFGNAVTNLPERWVAHAGGTAVVEAGGKSMPVVRTYSDVAVGETPLPELAERSLSLAGSTIKARYRLKAIAAVRRDVVLYAAEELRYGRPVTLEVLRDEVAGHPEFVAAVRAQATTLAMSPHAYRGLPRVYECDVTESGALFIALEPVTGITLRELIDTRGPLDLHMALRVASQVGEALETLHHNRLVHGELDLRDQPFDAHVGHRPLDPVARAEMLAFMLSAQPLYLQGGHDPPVSAVPRGLDPSGAIPPPERVEADPERAGSLGGGDRLLRQYLGNLPPIIPACSSARCCTATSAALPTSSRTAVQAR